MMIGCEAPARICAAFATAARAATVSLGRGARELAAYSNVSCGSPSTSRGSVRYTGPAGSDVASGCEPTAG